MAITIDATIGGASSNSYVTLAEAETYMETRVGSTAWDNAANDEAKKALLVNATRLLDQSFEWDGEIASSTQALRFPRKNAYDCDGQKLLSTVIPDEIKNATFEMALFVGGNSGQSTNNNISSAKVGSIEVTYRDNIDPEELVSSNVSRAVGCLGSIKVGGSSLKLVRY